MIGFIDTLYTQLITTINYSAITISTLKNSLFHPLVSSVFTSRTLATGSRPSHCNDVEHNTAYVNPSCYIYQHSQIISKQNIYA
jgi:hypothetical protein